MAEQRRGRIKAIGKGINRFRAGASNAMELLQNGRLTAPYRAPFEAVHTERVFSLRHYEGEPTPRIPQPLLLVPPLMVSSEIYDISPELSAISWLTSQGVDVWLVDFGKPEQEEGGLDRTLDDHILAVDKAIGMVSAATGAPVHVAGYSQGGMFAYQTAAYRRSKDVASLITFGSPVNIWRNLPINVHEDLTERFLVAAGNALARPLEQISGLPGAITSGGFKIFNARKEVRQVVGLFGLLHDREALEKREPSRRFLGGEGFVAWPGPAFRDFVDQMIVKNRMTSGGFVIHGRAVALADITCPVLSFVGLRDEMARPAAVRAIKDAAPRAEVYNQDVAAGHFGLVVGSRAMRQTWPSAVAWMEWRSGLAQKPAFLDQPADAEPESKGAERSGALYDMATEVMDGLWHKLGDVSLEVASIVDTMRWQLPRLTQRENITDETRVSIGRALAEQAEAIPDAPFFLWRGRAFTYAEANGRVNQVLRALMERGVKRGQHVGLFLDNHPDVLTSLTALSRLGAVAVVLNADLRGASLKQALEVGEVDALITDRAHAEAGHAAMGGGLTLCLGIAEGRGDRKKGEETGGLAALPPGTFDLEAALAARPTSPPDDIEVDPLKAKDTAMLLFTSGTTGLPKAARITNRRWATAALASAASCRLTSRDTVYCCLPLHHATGLLVACGGALVGGARLALAPRFSASGFWEDVHRNGVTVVFYVGELCRYLVNAPHEPRDKHPIRLFAGNGMRPGVWQRLLERFGPFGVLEFYGSTEGNVSLVNLTGDKIGSVGSEPGHSGRIELVRYDTEAEAFERDGQGRLIVCGEDEPGVLIARVDAGQAMGRFDGYTDRRATEAKLIRDVFEPGDAWFVTGDLLRRDAEGDYWFVDRLGDTFRWKGENVSTDQVQEIVSGADFVAMCVVYGVTLPRREGRAGMAAVELAEGSAFDGRALFELCEANLFEAARPRFVRVVERIQTTETLKPIKHQLQRDGANPGKIKDLLYWYDEASRCYSPLDAAIWARLTAEA